MNEKQTETEKELWGAIQKAYYDLGLWLKSQARFEEAEKGFREVIRINPDNAEAHNELGLLLSMKSRTYKEAEAEFREAIRIKPDYAEAYHNLGAVLRYIRQAQKEKAEKE